MEPESGRSAAFLERFVGVLVSCWCLVPIFIVFGFLFWASIEAPWPWKLLFIAALLVVFVGFVVWGGSLCLQCRRAREGVPEQDAGTPSPPGPTPPPA